MRQPRPSRPQALADMRSLPRPNPSDGARERIPRPDRNPLYAAADPPASGRCPTARGPSVRRARRLGTALALCRRMQEMRESEVASQFVQGLDYPIAKAQIVAAAREASLNGTLQDALQKIADREYSEPGELTQALNAAG